MLSVATLIASTLLTILAPAEGRAEHDPATAPPDEHGSLPKAYGAPPDDEADGPAQRPPVETARDGNTGVDGNTDVDGNTGVDEDAPAVHETPEPAPPATRRRLFPRQTHEQLVLGDLRYVPPMEFDSAFVTTHVRFLQGMAVVSMPAFTLEAREETFDVSLVGAMQRLEAGLAILPRLSAFGRIDGYAVVGTNTDSALILGARGRARWETGLHGELWRSEAHGAVVSGRVKAIGRIGQSLHPIVLVDRLIDQPGTTFNEVLSGRFLDQMLLSDSGNSGGISLNGAWTLHRHFGLQGTTALSGGTANLSFFDGSEPVAATARVLRATTGASALLSAQPHAPLALQLEYRHTAVLRDSDNGALADRRDHSHLGGVGLYVISGVATALGVGTTFLLDRSSPPHDQQFWGVRMMLQLQF